MNKCIHLIHIINEDIQEMFIKDQQRAISLIRLAFLILSMQLKDLKTTTPSKTIGFHQNAMADILYFYAFTHTYFTAFDYDQAQGDTVYVRKCDVSNVETYITEGNFNL